jgi:hypothetical protein
MTLRQNAAKQEHWEPVLDASGKPTGVQRNSVTGETKTAPLGGGGDVYKTTDISGLRNEVLSSQEYKDASKVDKIYTSLKKSADMNTRASDLDLVYGVASVLDPGSVVRGEEQQLVAKTQGWWDQFIGELNQMGGKATLTPESRKALLDMLHNRVEADWGAYDRTASFARNIAKQHGFDPNDAVPTIDAPTRWTPADRSGGGGGGGQSKPKPGTIPTNEATGKPYIALPNGKNVTIDNEGNISSGDMTDDEFVKWQKLNGISD